MTSEEKLDYIYETLKKQESRVLRATLFKWGFRIFMLLYFIYFIKFGLPALIDSILPSFPGTSGTGAIISSEMLQNMIQEKFPEGVSGESIKDYFSK